MRNRARLLAATTIIVALTVATAGAQHGGNDLIVSGEITAPTAGDPQLFILNPCAPPTLVAAVQGVTQFMTEIPQDTWNHSFALSGDDIIDDEVSRYDLDMFFFSKSGTTCTLLQSPYLSGSVTTGTTHAVVVLTGAIGHFTLTIDR